MTTFHVPLVQAMPDQAPDQGVAIRAERRADASAREALLDLSFGAARARRTCQRLRAGQRPAEGLAFTATRNGRLIGTLRLWNIEAGGVPALLLGPLAVDPACRSLGVGTGLMRHALAQATRRGHGAIVLLGDAPYYARFGFSAEAAAGLALPGPFERERLLALNLRTGALDRAGGMVIPSARARRGAAAPHRTQPQCHAA